MINLILIKRKTHCFDENCLLNQIHKTIFRLFNTKKSSRTFIQIVLKLFDNNAVVMRRNKKYDTKKTESEKYAYNYLKTTFFNKNRKPIKTNKNKKI